MRKPPATSPTSKRPPRRLAAGLSLAALVLLAVVACRSLGTGPHGRAPSSCADCHRAIAREWRASAHAQAWTGEAFLAESRQHRKAECLPCHAPQPVLELEADHAPRLRDARREDGVDCTACHRLGCAQAGPCGGHAPHPTVRAAGRLRDPAFCGRCHEQEYLQYRKEYVASLPDGDAKTCVACHMPASIARLTQGHLLSKAHPRRVVRHHGFDAWTPALLEGALEASAFGATRGDDGVVEIAFTLTNRGAGHRIPTGKHGYRELRIRVQLLDEAGVVSASDEESLLGDSEDGLRPGQGQGFEFELDAQGGRAATRVRLLVERVNEDESLRVVLLKAQRPLAP